MSALGSAVGRQEENILLSLAHDDIVHIHSVLEG